LIFISFIVGTFLTLYLQVLMESIDRVMEFVKRSNAVSPTVALETATALQVIISSCLN